MKNNSTLIGQIGEKIAKEYLENSGFKEIIHNNKTDDFGFCDFFALKDAQKYGIEVKASYRKNFLMSILWSMRDLQ